MRHPRIDCDTGPSQNHENLPGFQPRFLYLIFENSIHFMEFLVKVSDSLVNGAFGTIGDNGDNKWRQWMLHCRQWRFGEWRSPLATIGAT